MVLMVSCIKTEKKIRSCCSFCWTDQSKEVTDDSQTVGRWQRQVLNAGNELAQHVGTVLHSVDPCAACVYLQNREVANTVEPI